MTEQNHFCRVWDIIEKVGVCMLTTQFAGRFRPRSVCMTCHARMGGECQLKIALVGYIHQSVGQPPVVC